MHPHALIEFELFGKQMGIYPYGALIALGLVACVLVLTFYAKYAKMDEEVLFFTYFVAVFAVAGGFLFAKLFQMFYVAIENGFDVSFKYLWNNSGITAMGGFIGGAAIFLLVWYVGGNYYFRGKKKDIHKFEIKKIFSIAPICVTIAHAFGRLGCLMAGCCHGEFLGASKTAGGIYMQGTVDGISQWGYFVPTQLYEALFLFVWFGVLSFLFFKKYNLTHVVYLIGYGVWRIIIEFLRTDNRGQIIPGVNISPSQFQSILFILAGLAIMAFILLKKFPLKLEYKAYERKREDKIKPQEKQVLDTKGDENV